MRKAIPVFLTLFFLAFGANAQKFGWGLTGGLSLSTVQGQYPRAERKINSTELIPGFYFGTFLKWRPRRFFSMSSGFNYVSKGANFDANRGFSGLSTNAAQLRSIYFEIPVLVQLNFSPYTPNRPNIFFGPSFAWATRVQDNYTIAWYGTPPAPLSETGKYYNTFDPGIIIGGGIDIDVGDWAMFTAGLRYTQSLRNIVKPDEENVFVLPGFELRNVNVVLFASYTWVIPTYTMNAGGEKKKRKKFKPMNPKKYKG